MTRPYDAEPATDDQFGSHESKSDFTPRFEAVFQSAKDDLSVGKDTKYASPLENSQNSGGENSAANNILSGFEILGLDRANAHTAASFALDGDGSDEGKPEGKPEGAEPKKVSDRVLFTPASPKFWIDISGLNHKLDGKGGKDVEGGDKNAQIDQNLPDQKITKIAQVKTLDDKKIVPDDSKPDSIDEPDSKIAPVKVEESSDKKAIDAKVDTETDTPVTSETLNVKDKDDDGDGNPDVDSLSDQGPTNYPSADGKGNWTRLDDGSWKVVDPDGKEVSIPGLDLSTAKVKDVSPEDDGSVKLSLNDGSVLLSRSNGASLKYQNESDFESQLPSDLYKSNGDQNHFEFEGGKLKQANLSKPYFQVGENIWSEDPNAKSGWPGTIELNGRTGDLKVTANSGADKDVENVYRATGLKEIHRPDGTSEFSFAADGDPTKRAFKFEGSFDDSNVLKQPIEMTVTNAEGKDTVYKRTDDGRYNVDGKIQDLKIEVTQDDSGKLSYFFENKDTGYKKEIENGHVSETVRSGDTTRRTVDGKLVEAVVGSATMECDPAGVAQRIEHVDVNRLWTKDAQGKWIDQPLDQTKPYEEPDKLTSTIATHESLNDQQKHRMMENVVAMASEGHSQAELNQFYTQTDRLLQDNPAAHFDAKQRADLAEQLLWHGVHEKDNNQGSNPTCSVTHLRGLLLDTEPSKVAKVIADIAESGQFKTADGSVIEPPAKSLEVRPDSPEATFPPADGSRSWLSQIWDVTAFNVHFQRQEKDRFTGQDLNGGEIDYELRQSAKGDYGCRLVKTDKQGERFVLAKHFTDNTLETHTEIGLYMDQALDVYNQVTGETMKDRAFAYQSRYVGNKDDFDRLGGQKWSSLSDMESKLAEIDKNGTWPIYVDLNTSILKQRKDQQIALNEGRNPATVARTVGGRHVLLISDYDPVSKTVEVDNSWGTIADMPSKEQLIASGIDPATRISFSTQDLLDSMKMPDSGSSNGKAFRGWYWMKDR